MPRADRQHRPEARTSFLKARVTTTEAAAVERAAARLGLRASAFTRAAALDAAKRHDSTSLPAGPPSPTIGLPDADRQAVDALRAEVHKCGVNINQLVRLSHRGEVHVAALDRRMSELGQLCREVVQALGGTSL